MVWCWYTDRILFCCVTKHAFDRRTDRKATTITHSNRFRCTL